MPAFLIHALPNGNIRVVSLTLPRKMVGQMMHTAADTYMAQGGLETLN